MGITIAVVKALYEKAKELFAKVAAGEVKPITSEMVIAQIVWVDKKHFQRFKG